MPIPWKFLFFIFVFSFLKDFPLVGASFSFEEIPKSSPPEPNHFFASKVLSLNASGSVCTTSGSTLLKVPFGSQFTSLMTVFVFSTFSTFSSVSETLTFLALTLEDDEEDSSLYHFLPTSLSFGFSSLEDSSDYSSLL